MNNVVVAGKNNIAVEILDYLIKEYPKLKVYAVLNSTDNGVDSWQRSFKKYVNENQIEILTLEECYLLEDSLFLSLEFDKIVKPDLFMTNKMFNIHFSLLPSYKGMYTSALPLLNGESSTGVTLHEINKGIDTGNIIAQTEFELCDINNSLELYNLYIVHGIELVKGNLDTLLLNTYVSVPQPSYSSTYYSKKTINYSSLSLNFTCTAWQVKNQVKAFTFRPYQLMKYDCDYISHSNILTVLSTHKPGTLIYEDSNKFIISTIDYDIELIKDKLDLLLLASENGDLDTVRTILSHNPSLINEKNEKGWSAIIVATYFGQKNIIELLLSFGGNINDRNFNGTTVIMYAKDFCLKQGTPELLNFLIDKGAKTELKDFSGKTVFDYIHPSHSCPVTTFLENIK